MKHKNINFLHRLTEHLFCAIIGQNDSNGRNCIMKKTSILLFIMLFCLSLIFTACNGETPTSTTPTTDESNGTVDGDTQGGDNTPGDDNPAGGDDAAGDDKPEGTVPEKKVCQTPVLTWSAATETLSWQAVEGAAAYEVTSNGQVLGTTDKTSLPIQKEGTYRITVKAIAAEGYTDSAASAVKTVTVGWSGTVK